MTLNVERSSSPIRTTKKVELCDVVPLWVKRMLFVDECGTVRDVAFDNDGFKALYGFLEWFKTSAFYDSGLSEEVRDLLDDDTIINLVVRIKGHCKDPLHTISCWFECIEDDED
jgi:hypothetical protein